ncbi:LysR family transcriptional regulator [Thauera phenylacetica B4P]|uniref:LysR family transcriptional regulator n=1 Tax=Thauera phenylacetica B4P TaxID=1234382 RepID=N6ZT30_9RHOO|nr:LysR family transcriptional regulator [Thauera phenylacetica]ENO97463.1 LysR family transcriptional regulator [Thauera phenylacetica B4P]
MTMDIPALELLVAAIEEKSLSRAAERTNVVTSAASKRIIELERQLGVALLRRHGRGVEATPAGAMLYQRAKSILRGVRLAEEAMAEFAPTGIAKIRLAANRSTMLHFIPTVISRYLSRTPDTRIDLKEALSFDVPRLIAEGEADIGIYHNTRPAPGVTSYPYLMDRIVLVVPRGHPLEARSAVFLEEAIDYDFIGYFPRHSFEAFMELAEQSISRPLNVRVQVTNFEARCTMVSEGLGLAIMPEQGARPHACSMRLTCLPLKDDWATRQYYLCVRDATTLSPVVADLFSYLLKVNTENRSQDL